MNFDQFLKMHQSLSIEAANDTTTTAELSEFIEKINIAIAAHVEIHDTLKYQLKNWDDKCRRLCELRDGMIKIERNLRDDDDQN